MNSTKTLKHLHLTAIILSLSFASQAEATQVRVTVTNLAPQNGTNLTPMWLGFHDGGFDLYDMGVSAPAFLESAAEDGNTAPVTAAFIARGYNVQTTLTSLNNPPVFAPGVSNSIVFDLDPTSNRYLSFLSMIIPSNDAFIGNGNQTGHAIFDIAGNFLGQDFILTGENVRDAGTEVNDEIPANTAFLGQTSPNTGITENGIVGLHSGFIVGGNILGDARFANSDFKSSPYQIARIQVSAVPIPAAMPLMLGGLGFLARLSFRGRSRSNIA